MTRVFLAVSGTGLSIPVAEEEAEWHHNHRLGGNPVSGTGCGIDWTGRLGRECCWTQRGGGDQIGYEVVIFGARGTTLGIELISVDGGGWLLNGSDGASV